MFGWLWNPVEAKKWDYRDIDYDYIHPNPHDMCLFELFLTSKFGAFKKKSLNSCVSKFFENVEDIWVPRK